MPSLAAWRKPVFSENQKSEMNGQRKAEVVMGERDRNGEKSGKKRD